MGLFSYAKRSIKKAALVGVGAAAIMAGAMSYAQNNTGDTLPQSYGSQSVNSNVPQTIQYDYYEVKKGDTLWEIVQKQYNTKSDFETAKDVNYVADFNSNNNPSELVRNTIIKDTKGYQSDKADGIKGDLIYSSTSILLPKMLGYMQGNNTDAKSSNDSGINSAASSSNNNNENRNNYRNNNVRSSNSDSKNVTNGNNAHNNNSADNSVTENSAQSSTSANSQNGSFQAVYSGNISENQNNVSNNQVYTNNNSADNTASVSNDFNTSSPAASGAAASINGQKHSNWYADPLTNTPASVKWGIATALGIALSYLGMEVMRKNNDGVRINGKNGANAKGSNPSSVTAEVVNEEEYNAPPKEGEVYKRYAIDVLEGTNRFRATDLGHYKSMKGDRPFDNGIGVLDGSLESFILGPEKVYVAQENGRIGAENNGYASKNLDESIDDIVSSYQKSGIRKARREAAKYGIDRTEDAILWGYARRKFSKDEPSEDGSIRLTRSLFSSASRNVAKAYYEHTVLREYSSSKNVGEAIKNLKNNHNIKVSRQALYNIIDSAAKNTGHDKLRKSHYAIDEKFREEAAGILSSLEEYVANELKKESSRGAENAGGAKDNAGGNSASENGANKAYHAGKDGFSKGWSAYRNGFVKGNGKRKGENQNSQDGQDTSQNSQSGAAQKEQEQNQSGDEEVKT